MLQKLSRQIKLGFEMLDITLVIIHKTEVKFPKMENK